MYRYFNRQPARIAVTQEDMDGKGSDGPKQGLSSLRAQRKFKGAPKLLQRPQLPDLYNMRPGSGSGAGPGGKLKQDGGNKQDK